MLPDRDSRHALCRSPENLTYQEQGCHLDQSLEENAQSQGVVLRSERKSIVSVDRKRDDDLLSRSDKADKPLQEISVQESRTTCTVLIDQDLHIILALRYANILALTSW